jgi:hypothetical protein
MVVLVVGVGESAMSKVVEAVTIDVHRIAVLRLSYVDVRSRAV